MQNEELRRAQAELDDARARYFDLYDLAPVGYCTLSEQGLILETNLTAVILLGVPRGALVKQPISRFILKEDHDIYYLHRKQLFETGAPQVCELRLVKKDGSQFWARFEATVAQDGENGNTVCRTVVSDISKRKRVEEALQQAHAELEQRVAERTKELRQVNEELRTEITERKRAEEARRESEATFRNIADQLVDVLFATDNSAFITFISPSALQVFGLQPEDMVGRNFIEFLSDTEIPCAVTKFKDARASGQSIQNLPFVMKRKDGSTFTGELNSSVIWKDGRTAGTIGIIRDITERKLAEEALKESEERYRTQVESINDVAYAIGGGGEITYISPVAKDVLGYEPEEILGRHFLEIVHQEDHDLLKTKFAELREGLISRDEYRVIGKHGDIKWVRTLTTPIIDIEGFAGGRGILIDMTERKRAEQALRESEEKYRTLIETTRDLIYTTDRKGFLTYMNPTLERTLDYPHTEWNGKTFAQLVAPECIDSVKDNFIRAMNGESIPVYSVDLVRKDGTRLSVEFNVTTLYDSDGKPAGRYGIGRDVTERKRAEEEKRSMEERLQRSEKMEVLGTLAGGVAHDLNNVLGILVGYSELLLDDIEESSPAWTSIMEISRGSERAAAIVEDMLTLARRGVQTLNVFNLNKNLIACQKTPEFAKLSSLHPGVRISTNLEADLLNMRGSPVLVDKAIMNLVSNAVEAMAKGGTVTIKTRNQYLDKPIQGYDQIREGDYVVLSVSDTGEGIQTTDLKRIFEPFYTKKVMGRSGTGLGLAVVWGTVKDHHGYINVESEEGKGSTFTLYFPVTREDITAERIAVPVSEYMGSGESILVVDDVKEQRDLAAGMLRKLNYNVASVSSGEEAIAYLKEHKIDLMVLDMIMDPGMDGLDTYRQVLELHPKQKAIIVSGFSESDRVHAARDLGSGAYVRKPYIKEKLGLAVKKELADM
jgi:PAS domain S-box-containing protein